MAITSVAPIENRMIAMLYCVCTHERAGTFDDLIRNAPLAHADFVLNGSTKMYSEAVTEYSLLDQIT